MAIAQLGYLGIGVTDTKAWLEIATNIIGMQVRPDIGRDGTQYLRIDSQHHRFALHPADKDDILYAGWKVETEHELEALCEALSNKGIVWEEGSPQDCQDRKVAHLIKFNDPEGYKNELFCTPLDDITPFQPSIPMSGFKTGALGLGHIVRHCKDRNAMANFYTDVLGFKISDYIQWEEMDAVFLRCNPRHHSLALINESLGHVGGQTNHFMVEVNSIDDVGRAYDKACKSELPIIMTLGRHTNDHATSFYFVSPSGFGVEIGTDAVLVDDENWEIKTFNSTKIWGHLLPHERG